MSFTSEASGALDMIRLLRHGGPALCNVAVTNSCNATCDFCNFANGKVERKDLRWINAEHCDAALQFSTTEASAMSASSVENPYCILV
jgi:hypothetical protein